MLNNYNYERGITLISIVVTIIVLLILSAVSISMLRGDNGILDQVITAEDEYKKSEAKEKVQFEVLGSYDNFGILNIDKLKENIKENLNVEEITDEKDGGISFKFDSYMIEVENNGNVIINGEEISEEPSTEPSTEVVKEVKAGETAEATGKENYTDNKGKKATIPKNFKVSLTDNDIETGLVVEAPDSSQFIWVPVDKAVANAESEGTSSKAMAVKNGNDYKGLLYNFSGTTSSVINGCTTNSSTNREPAYFTSSSYDNNNSYNPGYFTESSLKDDFNQMIKSVENYGGFYVGRYESSIDGSKVVSKAGRTPMNASAGSANMWYGLYSRQRNYANQNSIDTIVGSSMIWGSQYDAMLNWILKGKDANKVTATFSNHNTTLTGSTSGDVMNKIYDLANNVQEFTLEATGANDRIIRGGNPGYNYAPSNRYTYGPNNPNERQRISYYFIYKIDNKIVNFESDI